ncbi:MAG: fibrobacter succinogenes major paralogous domain-containing protein [Bacteroidales bacterium]|nr:fibrobacter succinogenes major paralogous domain-containing protein [Bacteroidales bacterium]MCF8455104.1 fibrobacter succinogenes major paralogous domain-containing protein [Bacteroidales bacterium]
MKIVNLILILFLHFQIGFSQTGNSLSNSPDTQTIVLPTNWSIISTYIQPTQANIADVLNPVLPNLLIAKNGNGQSYLPQYGVNLIGDIMLGQGYQIKLTYSDTLLVTGSIIEPDTCPIIMPNNWSILGYLRTTPADIELMLTPVVGNLSILKDLNGQSYWPQYGLNLIGNMQPGQGYQIKLIAADTLIYPQNSNIINPNFACGDQIVDYDGNSYNTVQIGNQCWMKENLKTTHYPNGANIPYITSNTGWTALGLTNTDAYCYYNNNPSGDYGALYTWTAAMNGAGNGSSASNPVQGACPMSWHVPDDTDWTTLINYLGGINACGGQLKETGTLHWNSPNTCGTNNSGFNALPGGYRYSLNGTFSSLGTYGYWWSATEQNSTYARYLRLAYNVAAVSQYHANKKTGYSVRCVRD